MAKPSKYKDAKIAKVGEEVKCAYCGKMFKKVQYSQAFCCGECRINYHNKRRPDRVFASRERLRKLDEKREREKKEYWGYTEERERFDDVEECWNVSECLDIYS